MATTIATQAAFEKKRDGLWRTWMYAEGADSIFSGGFRYAARYGPPAPTADLGSINHYDPMRVYWNVRRYTGDPRWDESIAVAYYQWVKTFLDKPALEPDDSQDASTQDYHATSAGLRLHFENSPNAEERAECHRLLGRMPNFGAAKHNAGMTSYPRWNWSRGCAYGIMVTLDSAAVGHPIRRDRLELLVGWAAIHIDQWFRPEIVAWPTGGGGAKCVAVQCFMVSITLRALQQYHDAYPDPIVLSQIKFGLDSLWDTCWGLTRVSGQIVKDPAISPAFPYWDRDTAALWAAGGCGSKENNWLGYDGTGEPTGRRSLNGLFGRCYAWWAARGATTDAERLEYIGRHDAIFNGQAQPGHQKEYNQLYGDSIEGVWLREEAIAKLTPEVPQATAFSMSGPASVIVGQPAEFTVTPVGGPYTGVVTPGFDGINGELSPPAIPYDNSADPQKFSYKPADVGTTRIIATTNPPITNPGPHTLTVLEPFATFMAVSGPTSGEVGQYSDWFKAQPDGRYAGTATFSDGGAGGQFIPPSLTWDNVSEPRHTQYIPATTDEVRITVDTDPKLASGDPINFKGLIKGLTRQQAEQGRTALRTVAYTIHSFAQPNVGWIDEPTRDVILAHFSSLATELAGAANRSDGDE